MTVDGSNGTIVLDGGFGGELIRRGVVPGGGLWSAQALLDDPSEVKRLHRDYVRSGARIITTNTYSTIPSYLSKKGLEDQVEPLTRLACTLARDAVGEMKPTVTVAGCIPPLSESYRPDLVFDAKLAKPVYRCMGKAMLPYIDVFLCETMSCISEAVAALTALDEIDSSRSRLRFVSFTLDELPGNGLRSGETVKDAIDAVGPFQPAAILFNCTSPEAITEGIAASVKMTDARVGGYANRLAKVPPNWTLDNEVPILRNEELTIDAYVAYAKNWVSQGASIVGGCCGIGPEYIKAVSDSLVVSS